MFKNFKKVCCSILFGCGMFLLIPSINVSATTTQTISPGASIQVALDAIEAAGGGTLYINSGTYVVYSTVNVPNNVTVKGSGTTRPIIQLADGLDIPVIQNKSLPYNNIKLDFLEVNGGVAISEMQGNTKKEVTGIWLSDRYNTSINNTNGTVINCIVKNCAMGVIFGRTTGATISDTNISYCGTMDGTLPYHNIYISTCDKVKLYKVNSSYCQTGMGIKLTDFYSDVYGNLAETSISVDQCIANNNAQRGIAAYDLSNLSITNSQFKNNGASGINVLRCSGSVTGNIANGNYYAVDVAYDIWFNGCVDSTMTQSGNTYSTYRWS